MFLIAENEYRKFMRSCNCSFESSHHADFKNLSFHSQHWGPIKSPYSSYVIYVWLQIYVKFFRWNYESNGEVPLFGFPWHPSQPSNGNDERCIIVDNRDWSNSQGGKWFDSPCGGEVWFWSICQREGSVQSISWACSVYKIKVINLFT